VGGAKVGPCPLSIVGVEGQNVTESARGSIFQAAQGQWSSVVHVPVGATNFWLGFGTATRANINKGERAAGTLTETNGSTGFIQNGFDNQRLFVDANFIHELTFRSEQIAAGSSPTTNQFWIDRDTSPPPTAMPLNPNWIPWWPSLSMKRSER
jgi:hypothetical protein